MRGRSSSKQGISSKGGVEIDRLDSHKEEPHLSGAYIRSLVKQLTSSRTKDPPMNPNKDQPGTVVDDGVRSPGHQNLTKIGKECFINETQPPQQHKKQVRRRLHTSRPYQERLLNMAEARREIVTALKFHRAAMKQANDQLQQQSQPVLQQPPNLEQQEGGGGNNNKLKSSCSRQNPRINYAYACATPNFSNYPDNIVLPYSLPLPPNPYSWPAVLSPQPVPESLNLTLPNQTLGLNLNLHDFNNLDTATLYRNSPPTTYYSSSCPSTSSPATLSVTTQVEVPNNFATISQEVGWGGPSFVADASGSTSSGGGLHQAVDDEEMAEIRWLGEQHQMEWNDTLNLVTSAWWFKFLKTMEIGPEEKPAEDDDDEDDEDLDRHHPFGQLMEFPAWMNANDSCCCCCLQQHCPDEYLQDPALPCMDIGEIEGMDGDWLA